MFNPFFTHNMRTPQKHHRKLRGFSARWSRRAGSEDWSLRSSWLRPPTSGWLCRSRVVRWVGQPHLRRRSGAGGVSRVGAAILSHGCGWGCPDAGDLGMVGICWDFKGFRTGFGHVGVAFFLFLVHFEGWNLADTPTVEQLITAFFLRGWHYVNILVRRKNRGDRQFGGMMNCLEDHPLESWDRGLQISHILGP